MSPDRQNSEAILLVVNTRRILLVKVGSHEAMETRLFVKSCCSDLHSFEPINLQALAWNSKPHPGQTKEEVLSSWRKDSVVGKEPFRSAAAPRVVKTSCFY